MIQQFQGVDENGLPPGRKCYRLRSPANTDYNNIGDKAPHLKIVGYNALIASASLLNTTVKAYVHVAYTITEHAEPRN